MSVRLSVLAGLLPLLVLGACGDGGGAARKAERAVASAEAGYLPPPRVQAVRTGRAGVALAGVSVAGARVRLEASTGEVASAEVDALGVWTVVVRPSPSTRLFALSMTVGKRSVRSEGYLAVTPEGRAAQLRAGAGAVVLSPPSRRPLILALDFDRGGAAMISGVGTPNAEIGLRVDRTAAGGSAVDHQGRFAFALSQPLGAGSHEVELSGEGGEDLVIADGARAAPLDRLFRAERAGRAWRIDWMTPGGGLQSTLLFDRAGG